MISSYTLSAFNFGVFALDFVAELHNILLRLLKHMYLKIFIDAFPNIN